MIESAIEGKSIMRKKLTAEQKYNREYYQAHKGEKEFESRRARNSKAYRAKISTKKRRNKKLREKWATDAAYRKHVSEYQKEWRRKRKLAQNCKKTRTIKINTRKKIRK